MVMKHFGSGYLYIVLCAVIFSTMEIMLKTVSGVFVPMQITAIRFLIGGMLLIPFALRALRSKGTRLTRADLAFFLKTGFLCVTVSMVLYQMAITYTKASVVAVIFSCNPIFVTILAWLLLREKINGNHIAALFIEVFAIVIIINPFNAQLAPAGIVLSILAAVAFSFYSVVGKKRTPKYGGITVTCFSFLCGSAELILVLLLGRIDVVGRFFTSIGLNIFVDVPLFSGIPLSALPALFYICAVNSAAGYVCHMMALEKTSAREASIIFFLKPMIAPVFAYIFIHEKISLNMMLGILCFLIGSGVAIVPGLLEERKNRHKEKP